jgi:phosphatidylglycerol:prolipoprotein diacylglycerol transferase
MIPYLAPPVFQIGGLEVRGFGLAVCLAILAFHSLALRRARTLGLDVKRMSWLYAGGAAAAALTGHLWSILAGESAAGPFEIWSGQSAAGFIVGALLVVLYILWRWGAAGMPYVDALAFAFPFAWTLVRTGCFLAHDHIGARTASPLGVQFPSGTRFDLGLIEAVLALQACGAVILFSRRIRQPGRMFGLMTLFAGAGRVLLSAASESASVTRTGGLLLAVIGLAACLSGTGFERQLEFLALRGNGLAGALNCGCKLAKFVVGSRRGN